MFSFHKPKVYRSTTGCCICRAKSSSSRFTDSKKYEDDFMECFQLKERRTGEICNACVLLVKRWKKLPEGSERNWRHVVDARAGPGTKSLTKFKSKNKKLKLKLETAQKSDKMMKKKHTYVKNDRLVREHSPGALSDDIGGEDFLCDLSGPSMPPSLATSPVSFEHAANGKKDIKMEVEACAGTDPEISSFLDMTYWKRVKICCGTIFKGSYGEVIVDHRFLKPCLACISPKLTRHTPGESVDIAAVKPLNELPSSNPTAVAVPASEDKSSAVVKSFSDSSSDSGYDESSNPGVVDVNHARSDNLVTNPLADFAMHATNPRLQVPAPAN